MPQMAPLYWLYLFIFFFLSLIFFISMNYFLQPFDTPNTLSFSTSLKQKTWKL
uniref:ATP synthase complex subunit 8 n=1 Tax=Maja crispata TaxID=471962 RepID=A0A343E783_9EUCA|nr:ATP synthase F0 subunit 8 [Maja crispata]ASF62431.1 ATP synthase F0 subunit 8 [Maja crispata]